MAGPFFTEFPERKSGRSGSTPVTGKRGAKSASMKEKTANWPGTPGKTQPRDRSGGVRKLRAHPKSEGI